jgi:hypothetical protein
MGCSKIVARIFTTTVEKEFVVMLISVCRTVPLIKTILNPEWSVTPVTPCSRELAHAQPFAFEPQAA